MKIEILALTGILLVSFGVIQAHALWIPHSPEELLDESDTVLVGVVTAVKPVDVEYQSQIARNGTIKENVGPEYVTLDQYTVLVEGYLKNQQDSDVVVVLQATVGGVPGGPAPIAGFDAGDRVLLYLPGEYATNSSKQYMPESFKIPEYCNAPDVIDEPRIIGSNSFVRYQDGVEKHDNFTAGIPIRFVFSKDTNTLFGSHIDVDAAVSRADENQPMFEKKIHAESDLCHWIASAEWEFTLQEGDYELYLNVRENENRSSTSYTHFTVVPNVNGTKSPKLEPKLVSDKIENIDGILYYVIGPFFPNSSSPAKTAFHGVQFSQPYLYNPPRHIYTDVVFSDGTKETLSVLFDDPDFSEHVKPQAGFVQRTPGYYFLVSANLRELPPLRQSDLGIPFDQIQCRDGLVPITKSTDGSPVCVMPDSRQVLIERGWGQPYQLPQNSKFEETTIILPKGLGNPESSISPTPKTVTVVLGVNNTVRWINNDGAARTLTSDGPSWSTGLIKPGESKSITFNETGIFGYHGAPGPWIKGTIIVKMPEDISKIPEHPTGLTPSRLVFFVEPNSDAKIFVRYVSDQPGLPGEKLPLLGQFYTGTPSDFKYLNSTDLTISAIPGEINLEKDNVTATYTMSAKNVKPGLYWFTLTQICGAMPVAIGLGESQISPDDIPVYTQHCPAQITDSEIVGVSGGVAKYLESTRLR